MRADLGHRSLDVGDSDADVEELGMVEHLSHHIRGDIDGDHTRTA